MLILMLMGTNTFPKIFTIYFFWIFDLLRYPFNQFIYGLTSLEFLVIFDK